jgi:hypothetical protein
LPTTRKSESEYRYQAMRVTSRWKVKVVMWRSSAKRGRAKPGKRFDRTYAVARTSARSSPITRLQ